VARSIARISSAETILMIGMLSFLMLVVGDQWSVTTFFEL